MNLVNFILHIDEFLFSAVQDYGIFVYFILFLIIFLETGVVITPFLPGDSLIFAAGALSGVGLLNIFYVILLMCSAAILGDSFNYFIGKKIGKQIIKKNYVKKEYLERTENFYKKYGNKSIVIARFVPIVRTVVPFMAGIGKMYYPNFLFYNVFGALIWVFSFALAGYFFGNLAFVQKNLSIIILCIIILSVLPIVFEYLKHKNNR